MKTSIRPALNASTYEELCERIFEVHREVSFCAWNGMEPIVEPKAKPPGAAKRRGLIDAHFGPSAFDTIRARYKKNEVANDDVFDAFAALWTAERFASRQSRTLPETPSVDSAGLPMRIVY